MTSKSLSSKTLMGYNYKRNLWGVILSFLGFLFTLLVPTLMTMQQEHGKTAEEIEFFQYQVRSVIGGDNALVKVVFMGLAVVCGVAAFHYLHSRQRVDFYHSLAISRTSLFAKNFISGFLYVIPTYLIVQVIAIAAIYAGGAGEAIIWSKIFETIILHIVMFFSVYSFSVLATILCGNTIIALLLQIWIFFVVPVVRVCFRSVCGIFLETYAGTMQTTFGTISFSSPITTYLCLSGINEESSFYSASGAEAMTSYAKVLLLYFVLAVVVTAVSLLLFKIRKSEKSGTALAFEKIKVPVKIVMCWVIGVGVAMILQGISQGTGWFWFGLIIGIIIMHMVVEIIYAFDFRAILKKPIQMLGILAVAIAAVLGVQFDVMGYNTWLPDISDVSAMDLSIGYWYDDMEILLTDSEDIECLYRLAEIGVSQQQNDEKTDEIVQENGSTEQYYNIRFQLNNGKKKARLYAIESTQEVEDLMEKLNTSKGFRMAKMPLYSKIQADNVSEITISLAGLAYQEQNSVTLAKKEQVQQLISTLQEEGLKRSAFVKPVMELVVALEEPVMQNNYYNSVYSVVVTEEDVKTLALIKEFAAIEPVETDIDLVECIEIYSYKPNDETVNDAEQVIIVDNREDIKAFLENAIGGPMVEYTEGNLIRMSSYDASIYAVINGSGTNVSYLQGKEPTEMFEKYNITAY